MQVGNIYAAQDKHFLYLGSAKNKVFLYEINDTTPMLPPNVGNPLSNVYSAIIDKNNKQWFLHWGILVDCHKVNFVHPVSSVPKETVDSLRDDDLTLIYLTINTHPNFSP